jgi:carbon storage regulator CsrA
MENGGHLVLTRRTDEEVVLFLPGGGQIVVSAVKIDKGKVRLGFIAPKAVRILRRELTAKEPT